MSQKKGEKSGVGKIATIILQRKLRCDGDHTSDGWCRYGSVAAAGRTPRAAFVAYGPLALGTAGHRGESHAQSQLSNANGAYNNSSKPLDDCIPGVNRRRLLVALPMEGEPFRLATQRHHLVHLSRHRLLCRYRSSRWIR